MNVVFRVTDALASVVELGMRLKLLKDPNSPRSSNSEGHIYTSYSPSHPKAGQRLQHHAHNEPPRSAIEAWNEMEPWRQNLLTIIMTAAVTGFIIFMLHILVFPK